MIVKGKTISEETVLNAVGEDVIAEALKKHCKFEKTLIVSIAKNVNKRDRLIIRITENMKKQIYSGAKILVIDKDGDITNYTYSSTYDLENDYNSVKRIW